MSSTVPFASLHQEVDYIVTGSLKRGVDPAAVLSIASVEGLGAGAGDQGTSFGPFQLHFGGAYPSSAPQDPAAAQRWANSPAGVDYALDQIRPVAAGLQGQDAITAISTRFERPANPPLEISRASTHYVNWSHYLTLRSVQGEGPGAPSAISALEKALGQAATGNPVGAGATVAGAVPGASSIPVVGQAIQVGDFLGKLTDPAYILRALQVIGGAALVAVGVVLLTRQVALATDLPNPVASTWIGKAVK